MALIKSYAASGGKSPIALAVSSAHLYAINTASGGHAAYSNATPPSCTIDNMTFTYNTGAHTYTANIAGTYFYTNQSVLIGTVETQSQHAAANTPITLPDTYSNVSVVFIPD